MAHTPRNTAIAPGINRLSRGTVFAKKGLHSRKPKAVAKPAAKEEPTTKTKSVKGDKNGKERVIPVAKASRFYPAEDIKQPKTTRKSNKPTKLRPSITPGTVLILLAGRFRGKRVVFLKQLESGLLLVTGPFKVNGVPLRRVNQAYVIATSTKVDVSSSKLEKFNDTYFKKEKDSKKKGTEEEFFGKDGAATKKAHPENKAADQKTVDKEILAAVKKVPHLLHYLHATFSLSKGQHPHLLKF